jgi:hypothetical protein
MVGFTLPEASAIASRTDHKDVLPGLRIGADIPTTFSASVLALTRKP